MCSSIVHDPYSRATIDRRRINGSEPLRASKLARSKLLSRIAKCVKDRRILTVEMNSGVDLQPKVVSQSWMEALTVHVFSHEAVQNHGSSPDQS